MSGSLVQNPIVNLGMAIPPVAQPRQRQVTQWPLSEHDNFSHSCLYDLDAYSERLEQDSSRLFLQDSDSARSRLAFIRFRRDGHHQESSIPETYNLQSMLFTPDRLEEPSRIVFFIPQEDSHGSFLVTGTLFKRLMTLYKVFPPFLDTLSGFGYRVRSSDEDFTTYARRVSGSSSEQVLNSALTFAIPQNTAVFTPRIRGQECGIWDFTTNTMLAVVHQHGYFYTLQTE